MRTPEGMREAARLLFGDENPPQDIDLEYFETRISEIKKEAAKQVGLRPDATWEDIGREEDFIADTII